MGGRAVECSGLENRRLFTGSVSSNLTPSAICLSPADYTAALPDTFFPLPAGNGKTSFPIAVTVSLNEEKTVKTERKADCPPLFSGTSFQNGSNS